jgi:hypothetical protein
MTALINTLLAIGTVYYIQVNSWPGHIANIILCNIIPLASYTTILIFNKNYDIFWHPRKFETNKIKKNYQVVQCSYYKEANENKGLF